MGGSDGKRRRRGRPAWRPARRAGAPAALPALALALATTTVPRTAGAAQAGSAVAPDDTCATEVATYGEILRAMRAEVAEGYNVLATPHEGRFIGNVLLALARARPSSGDRAGPFLIRQAEFFPALLEATGIDSVEAPPSYAHAREFDQTFLVEPRAARVVSEVAEGPAPLQALSVLVTWPDTGSLPERYEYEDTISDPNVKVRHERVIAYRLLAFDSVVVYDAVEGVAVEPTSGAFGVLFKLLGMADLEETRYVEGPGGSQVVRARVKKVFGKTATALVEAGGKARKGLPEDHPHLALLERLERLLERPREMEYVEGTPEPCARASRAPRGAA